MVGTCSFTCLLGTHLRTMFSCNKCNFTTEFKKNLSRHEERCKAIVSFNCHQCDYSSPLKQNVQRHIARLHSNGKQYLF